MCGENSESDIQITGTPTLSHRTGNNTKAKSLSRNRIGLPMRRFSHTNAFFRQITAAALLLGILCANLNVFAFGTPLLKHEIQHDLQPASTFAIAAQADLSVTTTLLASQETDPAPTGDHELLHDVGHHLSATLCQSTNSFDSPAPDGRVAVLRDELPRSVTADGLFRPPRPR